MRTIGVLGSTYWAMRMEVALLRATFYIINYYCQHVTSHRCCIAFFDVMISHWHCFWHVNQLYSSFDACNYGRQCFLWNVKVVLPKNVSYNQRRSNLSGIAPPTKQELNHHSDSSTSTQRAKTSLLWSAMIRWKGRRKRQCFQSYVVSVPFK